MISYRGRFGRSKLGIYASRLAGIGKLPDSLDEPRLGMCANKLLDSLDKPRLGIYTSKLTEDPKQDIYK
ncbi:hypothetical protein RclHR1_25020001 [Rhizophagus clarus]|uniref:Uncharacterized protein n=1 Tax=Rhizophagus clarus TaxID=94130 RepID=A0A2Z6RTM2_9GLOM|nr:hypothetical protein RclHR1_25020001 [Rhizophagus clarus]